MEGRQSPRSALNKSGMRKEFESKRNITQSIDDDSSNKSYNNTIA